MTTFSLKLSGSLLQEIEQQAVMRGVPKSVVIRNSLERTLPGSRKAKKKPSCFDLISEGVLGTPERVGELRVEQQ